MSEYLDFAISLVKEAGVIALKYFRSEDMGLELKEDQTPLTKADTEINSLVIQRITETYSLDSIIGEEESRVQEGSQRTWVCDPIDGTRAFSMGIETFCISLGCVEDGEPTLGVIYVPASDTLYTAEKGLGAYCNHKRIHVSDAHSLSYTNVGFTASPKRKFVGRIVEYYEQKNASAANLFSAAHMASLVAAGKLTSHIFIYDGCWDAAAAKIIVEEAGGRFTSLKGLDQRYDQPIDGFVASNGHVHDELIEFTKTLR